MQFFWAVVRPYDDKKIHTGGWASKKDAKFKTKGETKNEHLNY